MGVGAGVDKWCLGVDNFVCVVGIFTWVGDKVIFIVDNLYINNIYRLG
jgi:hypothetical protein